MNIDKLFKLKLVLFLIYLLGLGIHLYVQLFLDLGYVTMGAFFQGWAGYLFVPFYLFGEFKDLSGASPAYFLLIPLGNIIFLLVILFFGVSRSKLQTLISYIVLLALTFITFKNLYTYSGTPWW